MVETLQRNVALVAGASLVSMALLAGFAYGYAFPELYVPGNEAATRLKVNSLTGLSRAMLAAFLLVLVLDVVVAWAFYHFFRPVHRTGARLMAGLRLVYAALLGAALLKLAAVVLPTGSHGAVTSLFTAFLAQWSAGLVVFGGHLVLVGWLMLRSGRIPGALGGLTLFAGLCYLLTNSAVLLLPGYAPYRATVDAVLSLPMALGELGLAIWLLVRGGRPVAR